VHLDHPASPHRHGLLPQGLQGLVGRPSGPKPIRAVAKVLLVERLQHHDHRPLQHLVRERRDADRTGLCTCPFRNMHPTHRRRPVRAGLGTVLQGLQVPRKILVEVRNRLSVHACGTVAAGLLIRGGQPGLVDVVGQRSESHLRGLFRLLRFSLLFRGHGSGFRCSGHVSLQRLLAPAFPPLPRVPVGRVPLVPRYYGTLRRPAAPPAALRYPSLGGTIRCACVRASLEPDAGPRTWSFAVWQPHASFRMETTGPPKFLGNPGVPTPWSPTPAGPILSGLATDRHGPRYAKHEGYPPCVVFAAQPHGLAPPSLPFPPPP